MSKLEIKSEGTFTKVYVDGVELNRVRAVNFKQDSYGIPECEIEFIPDTDICIIEADVTVKQPDEVRQRAAEIVRNELLKYGDWHDALVGSIYSGIVDVQEQVCAHDLAKRIADRIIGDEDGRV